MVTQVLKMLSRKSFDSPDETRPVGNGKLELVNLGEATIARITLSPGWRWSRDVRPTVGTDSCRTQHVQYVLSGRLMVQMDDGTRLELKGGDGVVIPPGHDAWVVGDEPFVAIDFGGMAQYAEPSQAGQREEEFGPYISDYD